MKPLRIVSIATCMLLCACGEDLTGEWRGVNTWPGGEQSELTVGSDQTGRALVYYCWVPDGETSCGSNPTVYADDFEVEWKVAEGDTYELAMFCISRGRSGISPVESDFTMRCEIPESDRLSCTGDGNWDRYDFQWER